MKHDMRIKKFLFLLLGLILATSCSDEQMDGFLTYDSYTVEDSNGKGLEILGTPVRRCGTILYLPSCGGEFIITFYGNKELSKVSKGLLLTKVTGNNSIWLVGDPDRILNETGLSSVTKISDLQYKITVEPNNSQEEKYWGLFVNVKIKNQGDRTYFSDVTLVQSTKDSFIDRYYAGDISKVEAERIWENKNTKYWKEVDKEMMKKDNDSENKD